MSATVANVREVLARARERLGTSGTRTILFLDEIHRFNKAQQDALLPGVEEGLVTLIGATTENPYFEVNSALLSRIADLRARAALDGRRCARSCAAARAALGVERARGGRGADRPARRRRRAQRAQHPRARRVETAQRRGRRRSRRGTSRTRRASGRSSTTRAATRTTTSSRRGSSRRAPATCRRPSTTSRRCSRAARTRASSRGG